MSLTVSDYNSPTRKASNVSRGVLYSDLDCVLRIHPTTKDLKPLYDLAAVKNSISNLVQTSYHERPFHPEIGAGIRELLFEPADIFTTISLRDEISRVLSTYEPRIKDVTIQIQDDIDNNSYIITIGFVVHNDQNESFELYLSRLR